MKNIKFRAWHKGDKKAFGLGMKNDGFIYFDMDDYASDHDGEYGNGNIQINEDNIMLCSNQKDVLGVDIYEKDIISFKQFNPNSKVDEDWVAEVYWDEANCALRIRTVGGVLRGFFPVQEPTIIGNMFQNPEKLV